MHYNKMPRFPNDEGHTAESIANMIFASIEAPHPSGDHEKLLFLIDNSSASHANFSLAVCFAKENYFFFKKELKRPDFTIYNIIYLSFQALYTYSPCWKVEKLYFNEILLNLELCYYHYIDIDMIINYLVNNDE